MKYCASCSKKYKETDNFCTGCGASRQAKTVDQGSPDLPTTPSTYTSSSNRSDQIRSQSSVQSQPSQRAYQEQTKKTNELTSQSSVQSQPSQRNSMQPSSRNHYSTHPRSGYSGSSGSGINTKKSSTQSDYLWFIAVGWWLGLLTVLAANILLLSLIGWPIGLRLLNMLPMIVSRDSSYHKKLPEGYVGMVVDVERHGLDGSGISSTKYEGNKKVSFIQRYLWEIFETFFLILLPVLFYLAYCVKMFIPKKKYMRDVRKSMQSLPLLMTVGIGTKSFKPTS